MRQLKLQGRADRGKKQKGEGFCRHSSQFEQFQAGRHTFVVVMPVAQLKATKQPLRQEREICGCPRRDRLLTRKVLPVWVSLESTAGLLRRNQPLFQTRAFVQRADLEPRVMTALRWKDFSILPSYSIRETYVGSSFDSTNQIR